MSIYKGRHISKAKYIVLSRSFIADIPASKVALIANVNRKTADRYYKYTQIYRQVILSSNKRKTRNKAI